MILKIMTPKQMITRLPILLAQLKAGNNSQKFKNEIRQLLYYLYRSKNLSQKQSIINKSNRFVYQFTDKLNLKNPNKNIALANLSIYYTWKNIKSEYNNNKFKISYELGMMNLICSMDHIMFLIFKIVLSTSLKKRNYYRHRQSSSRN